LRRFLLHAPDAFWQQMHRVNDRLRQTFIHLPDHRSRLIFDLDTSIQTTERYLGSRQNLKEAVNDRLGLDT
jgi:hypothetical protein